MIPEELVEVGVVLTVLSERVSTPALVSHIGGAGTTSTRSEHSPLEVRGVLCVAFKLVRHSGLLLSLARCDEDLLTAGRGPTGLSPGA